MNKRETLEAAAIGAGCLGRSQDDEPVFVLCARDPLAAVLVRQWAFHTSASSVKRDEALTLAHQMELWRALREGPR